VDEILDLVVTEVGDKEATEDYLKSSPENLINACRGLLVIDHVTHTVRFPHMTVLEYFRNSNQLKPLSHVAQVSLTYLAFDEFRTECESWEGVRVRGEKHKAGIFLAKNWGYYGKGCQLDEGVPEAVFGWLKSEGRARSIMQMEQYEEDIWSKLLVTLYPVTVSYVLVHHGLDILLELFLDGKTVIADRYHLPQNPIDSVIPNGLLTALAP
jgi:hypothetical protein